MTRFTLKAFSLSLVTLCSISLAHADDLLQRIKQKNEIVVATEARFAPFESVENGKIVGYVFALVLQLKRFAVVALAVA